MSAGLAIVAYVGHWTIGLSATALVWLQAAAAAGMALGLFCVFLEIGRKLRFLYVVRRPQTSWMTRETYFVALFYPAVAADLLWPHWIFHLLAALSAAGFLYSQARILYAGKGIPAWRHPLIPPMLVIGGLLEGTGLLAFAGALAPGVGTNSAIHVCGVALTVIGAGLWLRYTASAEERGIGPLARRVLAQTTPVLLTVGYVLPALLFAGAIAWTIQWPIIGAIAGLAAVAGGVLWKFTVITRACHQQGFAVPSTVKRRSSTRPVPTPAVSTGS
jgi:phenylacetyl-CoA:acceptor oxidoreductase subunit 2